MQLELNNSALRHLPGKVSGFFWKPGFKVEDLLSPTSNKR